MSSTITAFTDQGYVDRDVYEIVIEDEVFPGHWVTLDTIDVSPDRVAQDTGAFSALLLAHGWRTVGDWGSAEPGPFVSVAPTMHTTVTG